MSTNPSRRLACALRWLVPGCSLFAAQLACAQSSVTLYGVVDDGIAYVNNSQGASRTYLRAGNLSTSKFGFRGVEDLGGGLKTIFQVEAGFDLNTGANSSAGLLFNRQAFVGLQSARAGTVTAGRQYTPYYLFLGPYASSNWLTGATGAQPGDINGLDSSFRINNSVSYVSPTYAGFTVGALYGVGGVAGSLGRGQTVSAALRYVEGPLSVAAGYLKMYNTERSSGFDSASTANIPTSAVNAGYVSARSIQHAAIAGNYTIGDLTLGLNYANVRYAPGNRSLFRDTAMFNTYSALAAYRFTPAFAVAAGYSYTAASKANGIASGAHYSEVSLKEAYSLSKRTTLYALQAYTHASGKTLGAKGSGQVIDAAALVGDSQNSTPSSTGNQVVFMLGVTATF
ncbi:MAG TPA: porin [Trinickia sp.]|uniref:porin n=1 Tax=Trinickia sp. TaxID=2571163 RepID=UPI002BE65224|nr:porin [Trinickia sp.]HVW53665.1 porin [Trinickia sp.]